MKVVHITSSITGGAGIAALRLHRSLLKEDNIESSIIQKLDTPVELNREHIYTLYESQNFFYRLRRKLNLTPEKKQEKLISTYSKNYEYEIATFPTTSYRIEDHPLVQEADIIHLHWVANFLNYPTFFKKIKRPIVWTLHDMNPFLGVFHYKNDILNNNDIYGTLEEKIRLEKERYIHQTKTLNIVTPSSWLKEFSQESDIFKKISHDVIANSVNQNVPAFNNQLLERELKIDRDKPTILFIAHGVEIYRKGFDLLTDAINGLEIQDFNLISVGGRKTEVNPRISHIHLNRIDDPKMINQLYQIADITILPSREDVLTNVMIESFANGTPVISFSNGGMAEHIKTGENGILVNEIGVEPLKQAIIDFLSSKYTFDRNQIRQYAKEHFDEKKQAQKYIELYNKILKQ